MDFTKFVLFFYPFLFTIHLLYVIIYIERQVAELNRKIILLVTLIFFFFFSSGCERAYNLADYGPVPVQPHLYWKDIDVEVTSIDKKHWYASTHWYYVEVEVYSKEYDLTGKFEYKSSGAFINIDVWDAEVGDTVKAELYSWVYDSTGEVVKREIHRVY